MAAEQERQLGQRNRAFARRIAARARPATVTGGSSAVPGWIQRARDQATSLAKGGIQPRVRPAATLRLARPVVMRPVEDAPPLTLARPVAPPDEVAAVAETPPPTVRPAAEPVAAPPFHMADVRRELQAAPAEARQTWREAPIQATSETGAARGSAPPLQPPPTADDGPAPETATRAAERAPMPSEPASVRRAVSRLEEQPRRKATADSTQVEADATVGQGTAPTEAALPAAAPTPPPNDDRRSEGAAPSPNEDEGRARHAVPLPVTPEAQEAPPAARRTGRPAAPGGGTCGCFVRAGAGGRYGATVGRRDRDENLARA